MLDTAIIGGGLSGLALAKNLLDAGRSFAVFESRERFGGRINSVTPSCFPDAEQSHIKYDLGPSWVWPAYQPRLAKFLQQNRIAILPQWTKGQSLYQADKDSPPQVFVDETPYAYARRIVGGSARLVESLLQQLPQAELKLSHHLQKVFDRGNFVELHFNVSGETQVIAARRVIITIPPRLIAHSLSFQPELDSRFLSMLKSTATWMAGHAKAVVCYDHAFWRQQNYSGSAFASYIGAALGEVFDVCMEDGSHAALSGFFALPAKMRQHYQDDLEALILAQLVRLYGKPAAAAKEIIIKDWAFDPLTATADDEVPPATHPQYGHTWLQLDHWNEKLYFAGTETAQEYGGYLEGALESAERVSKALAIVPISNMN